MEPKKVKSFLVFMSFFMETSLMIVKVETIASAIEEIVQVQVRETNKADLIYFGANESEKLAETVLAKLSGSISFQASRGGKENPWKSQLNTSSILLFDSVENFVQQNISWQTHKTNRYRHLVYIVNVTISDLEHIEDGFSVDNVNFLIDDNSTIRLVSGFMFSPTKCRLNQFLTINTLNTTAMEWETENFYPDKYKNFFGCSINIAITDLVVQTTFKVNPNGEIEASGYTIEVIKALAQQLNFKINYTAHQGLFSAINDTSVDFYALSSERLSGKPTSVSYVFDVSTFFIPPGTPLTQLEKLFCIFDETVWSLIAATLLGSFVIIQIINRADRTIQRFVFGATIKAPTMNLVSTFLIGNQPRMPGRNFSRFIVISYIVWCLIFRTVFQSMLFKNLQRVMRRAHPFTFKDIIDQGLTFYGDVGNLNTVKLFLDAEMTDRLKFQHVDEGDEDIAGYFEMLKTVAEPANQRVMISTKLTYLFIKSQYRSGFPSFHVLDQTISTVSSGLLFKSGSPFYPKFNSLIHRLIDSGLTDLWIENVLHSKGSKWDEEEIGPQVLSLDHLGVYFTIHAGLLLFCVAVFVIEIAISKLVKYLSTK